MQYTANLSNCKLGNFHAFLPSADFFQSQLFEKNSVQLQTVCQGYQRMTLVDKVLTTQRGGSNEYQHSMV